MLDDIKKDSEKRMIKSVDSLKSNLAKIRTGRAHPSILEGIKVDYYGNETPLSQVSSIKSEDARTLVIVVWEKDMVNNIEKAIINSDLGLNPAVAGTNIRIPMPPLTEERRMDFIKLVKSEVEQTRVAIRNIRRDANTKAKELLKKKEISEDDEKKLNDFIQKITDSYISNAENLLKDKEADLMQV
ncbi:MAG: ribosome recycling factor [Gammaproteobacteria bacterium]|jgi:ribosome recycling factor|nr:ribosome recycling factor [Gammaproteobacteria bacterium]MBT7603993.1 ribosome recycling factor [Gammaproteobacteria bacterium]